MKMAVKQLELSLEQKQLRRFSLEQMGRQIYPFFIELKEEFLKNKLGASSIDKLLGQEEKTDVCCPLPLCGTGVLEKRRVEPIYSRARKRHHTGNFYQYVCTNTKCKARFEGIYSWSNVE